MGAFTFGVVEAEEFVAPRACPVEAGEAMDVCPPITVGVGGGGEVAAQRTGCPLADGYPSATVGVPGAVVEDGGVVFGESARLGRWVEVVACRGEEVAEFPGDVRGGAIR